MYQLNRNKFLSDQELSQLESSLNRFRNESSRDVLLIKLALATGARAQELLNISPMDLSLENKSVFIKGLKGSSDREIPLSHLLFKELFSHARESSHKERLFSISYSRLVQIWNDFRPGKKKFHALRHTFALRLYKKTKDVKLVQMALGHTSLNNTMIYVDFEYKQNELRRLIL